MHVVCVCFSSLLLDSQVECGGANTSSPARDPELICMHDGQKQNNFSEVGHNAWRPFSDSASIPHFLNRATLRGTIVAADQP